MDEVVFRIVELPPRVNAVTVVDENGDFNVYVNARLSYEEQQKAYLHEKQHIRRHHFHSQKPVETCEREAKQ
jgi:hypothetical protein